MTALPRLSRLETYVVRQTLRGLGATAAVIAGLVMLIDFVELSRSLADEDPGAFRLIGLMLLKSPAVILQLLPFVFLFGTLSAYITLNRRSELVAMRAAGVSAWRFVFPSAGLAVVIGVLTVTVLSPAAASMDGLYQRERLRIENAADASAGSTADPAEAVVWLREGEVDRQMVIRASSQDLATGRLNDASFFIYATGADGRRAFTERIDARTAQLSAGRWRLTDAVGAVVGQQGQRYATLDLPSTLADHEAFQRFSDPDSTPFWSLPNQIGRIEDAGFSATAHRLKLQQLLSTPLMFGAMSILAAAFSLRLMRLGDLARMTVAAVLLGFGFFFVNQFASALGSAQVAPPVMAAWLPPILTALSAFTLLFYTEDG